MVWMTIVISVIERWLADFATSFPPCSPGLSGALWRPTSNLMGAAKSISQIKMKRSGLFAVGFLFFHWAPFCVAETSRCLEQLPGEESITYDTIDTVKITKLKISQTGMIGYVATEYLGATNLQAAIYLKKNGKYCFSGDFGPATDFKINKSIASNGIYGISITSNSGEYKFQRHFIYNMRLETYKFHSCQTRRETEKWKDCTLSEKYEGSMHFAPTRSS